MAFKYPERRQEQLFPTSIEEYIPEDDPVRAYDAVVDMMDLEAMGIETDEKRVGNSQYDPRSMLKLLVYGYSYGLPSARKLEKATHHNISFIWLMGGLQPNYKTISEFRRKNRQALKKALHQVVQMCIELDLITGNTLFIDGTKIRANASISQTWDAKRCKETMEQVEKRIEEILAECEAIDKAEESLGSEVELKEELQGAEKLRGRVQQIWNGLQASKYDSINSTDPDARPMKGRQGSHSSYNVQTAVDDLKGLIVSADAIDQSNDRGNLSTQVTHAEETLGQTVENVCADAGYSSVDDIEKIHPETTVIVPSQRQMREEDPGPFDRERFTYVTERDCYICPEGHELHLTKNTNEKGHKHYRMKSSKTCKSCRHYEKGKCTSGDRGRQISRLTNEELREHLEAVYNQEESQRIYARRKERVELPFGHIKHNLRTTGFLLRGFEGVKAEVSLLCSCFNIRRMITLLGGVPELIYALSAE